MTKQSSKAHVGAGSKPAPTEKRMVIASRVKDVNGGLIAFRLIVAGNRLLGATFRVGFQPLFYAVVEAVAINGAALAVHYLLACELDLARGEGAQGL